MGLLRAKARNGLAAYAFWMVVLLSMAFRGTAAAQAVPGLAATRVASGLPQPLYVAAPPGDYDRLFIVCQTGQVYILMLASELVNLMPFLDIHARLTSTNGEQGLLGLAFDPGYATHGNFISTSPCPAASGEMGRRTFRSFRFRRTPIERSAVNPDTTILFTRNRSVV